MTLKSTIAFMPSLREFLLSDSTARWAGLGREIGVYFNHSRTSIFRFVREHIYEVPPTSIVDGLGEVHSRQPLDVQLLYGYQRVGVHQPPRLLMQEVPALMANLMVSRLYPHLDLTL